MIIYGGFLRFTRVLYSIAKYFFLLRLFFLKQAPNFSEKHEFYCPACENKNPNRVVVVISIAEMSFLSKSNLFFFKNFLPYYECGHCGSHYLGVPHSRTKVSDMLNHFYTNLYRGQVDVFGSIKRLDEPRFHLWRDYIVSSVKITALKRSEIKILDCGCAEGILGSLLEREGFQTFGIEPSKPMINFAVSKLQLSPKRYMAGIYTRLSYPQNYFDVVVSYHVIEHVQNPLEFIRNIFFHLKPGGILFISTPSAQYSELALKKFKKHVNYVPSHLFLLSELWFIKFASLAGFKLEKFNSYIPDPLSSLPSAQGEKPFGMNFILRKPLL